MGAHLVDRTGSGAHLWLLGANQRVGGAEMLPLFLGKQPIQGSRWHSSFSLRKKGLFTVPSNDLFISTSSVQHQGLLR